MPRVFQSQSLNLGEEMANPGRDDFEYYVSTCLSYTLHLHDTR